MKPSDKIFVAGHRGMVGSALVRALSQAGFANILTAGRESLDLEDSAATLEFLRANRPDVVIDAAAKVGGIQANRTQGADFIGRNLAIQQSLIWGSHKADIPKLLFISSSCVYPRDIAQPMKESAILTAPMEPTNLPYAAAKIAGMVMVSALRQQYGREYFSVLPPNIYGPGDNFDPQNSHVLGGLMRRFHEALPNIPVTNWGSGSPKREFLHVDDAAQACLFLLRQPQIQHDWINIGTGTSIPISELSSKVQRVVGHSGPVEWNTEMPDGFPEKTMDCTRVFEMGWTPRINLDEGLIGAYEWFRQNRSA